MSAPLTELQEAALRYIAACVTSPTYREIGQAVGAVPPESVRRVLDRLQCKGYIVRKPGVPRSIRVLRLPE